MTSHHYMRHVAPKAYKLEREVAYELAIRHPRVIEILNAGDGSYLSKEAGEELYYDYGLNTYRIEAHGYGADEIEVGCFTKEALYLDYVFINFHSTDTEKSIFLPKKKGTFDFKILGKDPVGNTIDKLHPQKLLPKGRSKGGAGFKTILNGKTLKIYDDMHIYNIKIGDTDSIIADHKEIKRKNKLIYDYIHNKRWFEILKVDLE